MIVLFETLVKLALSPLLTAQALRARKDAVKLPEPLGHRHGTLGQGPDLSIVIVGDSSAAGVGAQRQSYALSGQLAHVLSDAHRVTWDLVARTGTTTRTALPLLSGQTPVPMDIAVVVLGVNDITSQVPLKRLLKQREALYARLRQDWSVKRIIATGIPPIEDFPLLPNPLRWVLGMQARRFDAALANQARTLNVDYLPFEVSLTPEMMASDGFHPGPNAYRLMAKQIAAYIKHRIA